MLPKGKLRLRGCLVTVPGPRRQGGGTGQTLALCYFPSAILNFMTPWPCLSSLPCGPLLAPCPPLPHCYQQPSPQPRPSHCSSEACWLRSRQLLLSERVQGAVLAQTTTAQPAPPLPPQGLLRRGARGWEAGSGWRPPPRTASRVFSFRGRRVLRPRERGCWPEVTRQTKQRAGTAPLHGPESRKWGCLA